MLSLPLMETPSLFTIALELAAMLVVGRVVLSLLPPGWPGRHDRRELGPTLAVSLVLGYGTLLIQNAFLSRLGLELPLTVHMLPWLLIGFARMALGPGALRPRHDVREARAGSAARALTWIGAFVWLITLARLVQVTDGHTGLALPGWGHALAGGVLIAAGFRCARRAPLARAMAWVMLAVGALFFAGDALSGWPWYGTGLTLGAVGMVAWLRRADRRGLALAALGFALTLSTPGALPIGLAALASLVACTPPASRKRALVWAISSGLPLLVLLFACYADALAMTRMNSLNAPSRSLLLEMLPVIVLPLTMLWVRSMRPAPVVSGVDPVGREGIGVGVTLSACIAGATLSSVMGGLTLMQGLTALFPMAVLFIGLVSARTERP